MYFLITHTQKPPSNSNSELAVKIDSPTQPSGESSDSEEVLKNDIGAMKKS